MIVIPIKFSRSGSNSIYISSSPDNESLIIFIHGFRGVAEDAWGEFPEYCASQNAFPEHDVIFYGYRAGRGRAFMSGGLFYDAIASVYDRESFVNKNFRIGERKKQYGSVFIVGHSLGCVVARFALLTAIKSKATWAENTRLLQFAPAHNGADFLKLLFKSTFFTRSSLGNIINLLVGLYYPCVQDLEKGSPFLTDLARDVASICENVVYNQAVAAVLTAFGETDSIVDIATYGCDAGFLRIEGKGHSDLVKLKIDDYLDPYERIVACI